MRIPSTPQLLSIFGHVCLCLGLLTLSLWFVNLNSGWYILGPLLFSGTCVAYIPLWLRWYFSIRRPNSLLLLLLLFPYMGGCVSSIKPGHVGIKVHLYGGEKGVDFEPLPVGLVWYNPWTTSIYTFPTFVQTAVWTANPSEGHARNEELSFNTREGMVVSADISLSYHLDGDHVPTFFAKFRTDQIDTFTHGFMRNIARDAFSDLGPLFTVEDVYGEKKETLRRNVLARVQEQVGTLGVVIEQFGYLGALRLPDAVVQSLNAKIQATQIAMRVQNEIATAQAEAKKTVAVAEGNAQARIAVATAEAQANKMLAASISRELVEYLAIQRWDGHRPTVESGTGGLSLLLPTPIGK